MNALALKRRCDRCGTRVGWVGLCVDVALVATKLIAGMETGSRALMSDSLYSLLDVVSSIMVIASVRASHREVDADHPYGHGKVEFLGMAAVALCIAVFALLLLYRAAEELLAGETRTLRPIAAAATVVAIVACTLIWRWAHCAGTRLGSPVIMADAEHHKADAISSVAVLGSVVLSWVGLGMLDPLVAVLENLHVLALSAHMLRRGVDGLLDASVDEQQTLRIAYVVRRVPGVLGVEDVRARHLGSALWVELIVRVAPRLRMADTTALRSLIRSSVVLHVKHVSNLMVQFLPATGAEPDFEQPQATEKTSDV